MISSFSKKIILRRFEIIKKDIRGYYRYLFRVLAITAMGTASILVFYNSIWKPNFLLALNKSESLPQKLFLVIKRAEIKRGSYIAFYPKRENLYGPEKPFLKIVGGISGDKVSKAGEKFYINGKYVGSIQKKTRDGQKLIPGPTGIIKRGYYYVYTKHPKSYDSRYKSIGWVGQKDIVGRAYPLF